MSRRVIQLLLALTAAATLLAGCGGDDEADGDETSTTETTASETSSSETSSSEPGDEEPNDGDAELPADDDGAQTSPAGGEQPLVGSVDVVVTHPNTEDISYTIDCLGDTFTVTPDTVEIDGATACQQLAQPEVMTRLVEGQPADQICTDIYGGPDEATITGELDGQAIDATIARTDGCGIHDWDELLAGVLPPAVGVTE